MAFVRVGRKPVAGIGPGGVYGRGRAGADGHCIAGAVFDAGGGGRLARRARPTKRLGGTPRPTIRCARRARPIGVAELFGRDGIRIGPEAATISLRIQFGGGVGWIGVEPLVVPSEAVADHLEIDVGGAEPYRADDASVFVLRFPRYGNVLAEDVIGEPLLALLPERLILLRRVDGVKADFVFDGRAVGAGGGGRDGARPSRKDGDRVAVRYLYHPSAEVVAKSRTTQETEANAYYPKNHNLHYTPPRVVLSIMK